LECLATLSVLYPEYDERALVQLQCLLQVAFELQTPGDVDDDRGNVLVRRPECSLSDGKTPGV